MKMENDNSFNRIKEGKKPIYKLTPYIDAEGLANLHKFKYNGSDTGIVYRYFYNPVALWCVNHTSENIAPNVVSKFGFNLNILIIVDIIRVFVHFGSFCLFIFVLRNTNGIVWK